jgi:cobalt-precorrin 5A hydrolase
MRLAIVSVTSQGAKLGRKLQELLTGGEFTAIDGYSKQGRGERNDQEYENLSVLVNKIFSQYDGFVFIMATGIVVRTIAALIQDKRTDPAVIVSDETGKHVISLLSGHLGRANYLATLIAGRLAATPVITTASDVQGKMAPDVMAAEVHLTIDPFGRLKKINTMLVEGQNVSYFLDEMLPEAGAYADWLRRNGVSFRPLNEFPADADASILITDKQVATDLIHLYLRPKTLVAGIGCRRGTEKARLLAALADACSRVGRSLYSVGKIASVSIKADETGLLAAAQELAAETLFFEPAVLSNVVSEQGLETSEFVKNKIGVGSVCEAAAICGAKNNQLLVKKQMYQGITIALAEVKSGL